MFITFEGPEGSGKTTQIKLLTPFLQKQGFAVVATREPGGTSIGDQIRVILHAVGNREMQPISEVLLYSASRAQLVRELVQPALRDGKIVLCDRFADSTIAYQGYGRGLSLPDLQALTKIATGGLQPDLTLFLDIDVELGLARRVSGGDEMNRLDLETVAFHQRVRAGYHQQMQADPQRWVVVDANRSPELVQIDLRQIILNKLISRS
ncbi:MAG: dTMP kinase [Anaerolineales bacterium]|nr:dTMP kinase [Anaerolineales bacterium]